MFDADGVDRVEAQVEEENRVLRNDIETGQLDNEQEENKEMSERQEFHSNQMDEEDN